MTYHQHFNKGKHLAHKHLKLKRNRRRILYVIGIFLIIGLITGHITDHTAQDHRQYILSQQIIKRDKAVKRLSKDLKAVEAQKATTEQQVQQKAQEEVQLKAQIDNLNQQLQAKAEQKKSLASRVIQAALPTASAVSYGNSYDWGNCTYFVASRIRVPNNLGNANTWAYMAAQDGYLVTSVPKVGAVAQTSRGGYGHVAIVIGVGDGTVTIDEMNVRELGVESTSVAPAGTFNYIYF